MISLLKTGRFFYGTGIAGVGVHQLITGSFRPDVLPPFPAWAHQYSFFPIIAGVALVVAGVVIAAPVDLKVNPRRVALSLGFSFLVIVITCHLPYLLFIGPEDITQLQFWFGVGETLAYSGGAFVIAGSFSRDSPNKFESLSEKLATSGVAFYALLILIFGLSHFIYTTSVSTMVPKWIGAPFFWTYFFGAALIAAAVALVFRIWTRLTAFLLAFMLFLFFLFFHIPDAMANPRAGAGNEIVRAMVALLFCGIALVIATTSDRRDVKK